MANWRGKPNKGWIKKKPPKLDEGMWEGNQKIIKDIVIKKRLVVSLLILYFLSYFLACFVAFFAGHLYFYFVESLTIGFAIGKAKSKDVDIAFDFFKLFL